ncbi:MAG: M23 family metallopeptidase [Planctomycetota bacterium]
MLAAFVVLSCCCHGPITALVATALIATAQESNQENNAQERASALSESQQGLRDAAAQMAETAASIRINGRDRDWDGIPTFEQNVEHDVRQLDLNMAALAPMRDAIYVLIGTRGRPVDRDGAYWINFDVWGHQVTDFQIGLSTSGRHKLWFFEDGEPVRDVDISGIDCKISAFVTARIPLDVIRAEFAANDFDFPDDPTSRGWVRIETLSWDHDAGEIVEYGPSAAAPVLDRPEFFDAPIDAVENPEAPYTPVSFPLKEGKWYLGQGPFGLWTHQDQNSYDLYLVDAAMGPADPRHSQKNEDYYCWGVDVIAPARGRVIRSNSESSDHDPLTESRSEPNEVYLNIDGLAALDILHLQEGSVSVAAGDIVEAGTVLGRIGNTGSSSHPHLHMDLWKMPQGRQTLPLAFENVYVSLNPCEDCPWTRRFSTWVAEEGFFVEPIENDSGQEARGSMEINGGG